MLSDDGFRSVLDAIQDAAVLVFKDATATMPGIEAAHRKVQAVQLILDELQSRVTAGAIQAKRDEAQHRGND